MKAGNLSVWKVRQFLHSKPSYTKFILATGKFKRLKAFARFKKEIWCMDLAYVDKLAKDNKGVIYLLVRQSLFDRTVDAKALRTKVSKEPVRELSTMSQKIFNPQKFWWTWEQILLESFKTFAKLKQYKKTLRWVRLRLLLLNVHCDPCKIYFTVTRKFLDSSTFLSCLSSSQPRIPEEVVR